MRPVHPSVVLGSPQAPSSACLDGPARSLHNSTPGQWHRVLPLGNVGHGLGSLDLVQNTPDLRNSLEGFKSRK